MVQLLAPSNTSPAPQPSSSLRRSPLGMGRVKCYLIQTAAGHVLIDTGGSNARKEMHAQLERAGCMPGALKLVLLTHGDFDHIGNAAYLRATFGANIAMHRDDS